MVGLLCIHHLHLDTDQLFHCIDKSHSCQSERRGNIHSYSVHSCYQNMQRDTGITLGGQILERLDQAGIQMFILSSYTSDNQPKRKQRSHYHSLSISFRQHQSAVSNSIECRDSVLYVVESGLNELSNEAIVL